MAKLYRKGFQYKKVGVMLNDITSSAHNQQSILATSDYEKSDKLMNALDEINNKMGTNKVFHASQGTTRAWQMKSDLRSPRYTTQITEILHIN